jgi:hypothetical protein
MTWGKMRSCSSRNYPILYSATGINDKNYMKNSTMADKRCRKIFNGNGAAGDGGLGDSPSKRPKGALPQRGVGEEQTHEEPRSV